MRSRTNLLDEFLTRQPSFRQGRRICLADGQTWVLPSPPDGSEWKAPPFGAEYQELIQAMLEAEDDSERRLAELAFAILLLGHNYQLSPADYERLLGFAPESPESSDWQVTLHQIAQDHLQAFLDHSGVCSQTESVLDRHGRRPRLLSWLRNHLPSGWFSFVSRP